MKNLITLLFGVFVVLSVSAQSEETTLPDGPAITFEQISFDFGDIHQGDKVEHIFKFENSGNQPLIITNVQTTCGCTASEWPREPILPGETANLKVNFDSAGKYGIQHKIISVISNAVLPIDAKAHIPSNYVKIIANVLPKEESN